MSPFRSLTNQPHRPTCPQASSPTPNTMHHIQISAGRLVVLKKSPANSTRTTCVYKIIQHTSLHIRIIQSYRSTVITKQQNNFTLFSTQCVQWAINFSNINMTLQLRRTEFLCRPSLKTSVPKHFYCSTQKYRCKFLFAFNVFQQQSCSHRVCCAAIFLSEATAVLFQHRR